jgi:hypothetical protein
MIVEYEFKNQQVAILKTTSARNPRETPPENEAQSSRAGVSAFGT